jgi:hypothetical protein
MFGVDHTEQLNSEGKEVGFEVTYVSGYELDDDEYYKNELVDWKAIKSDKN